MRKLFGDGSEVTRGDGAGIGPRVMKQIFIDVGCVLVRVISRVVIDANEIQGVLQEDGLVL